MNKRGIIIFYLFSFLIGFYLANGTTVLFEQRLGFSYAQIFSLGAFYMLMFVLFTVPTGALADLWGRKKVLVLGSFLLVAAAITTGISNNFWQVFFSFFLWSAGFSMIIGADQALLFDATRNDTTYAKDWGRASFFALMGTAAAGIFGPMLYNKHFRLPYLFSALPFLLAALVFLFFQEKHHSSDFSWKTYWHNNTEGLKLAFKNRHVRWATGVLALTFGAMYTFTNSYQPYLTSVGFDVKTFSLILPGMFLLEALGGAVSGKLYEKFGDRPVFILGLLILAATLAILGLYPHKVAIVLLFAFNLLLGIVNPVTSAYTNRYVGGELRATIISAQAVVATVSAALMLFLFGLLTDKVGLNNLLIILAVIIFVAGGLLLLNQPKEKSS